MGVAVTALADKLRRLGFDEHEVTGIVAQNARIESAVAARSCPRCCGALRRGSARPAAQQGFRWFTYQCDRCSFDHERLERPELAAA